MAKSPPTILDLAVTEAPDGTWGFQCPNVAGNACGEPGGVGFSSTGWPDREHAAARGAQHFDEHKLGAQILNEIGVAVRAAVTAAVTAASAELDDETPDDERAAVVQAAAAEAAAQIDRPAIAETVTASSDHSPMQELAEFRADRGLTVDPDGNCVKVEDL